ncbi:MAG: ATP-binding protein [Arcobacter sp.]|uniref:ATP-binding protein n=1 Tax=Arcobacter sp. TaxID=1872629 RepID=UPI003AFFD34C
MFSFFNRLTAILSIKQIIIRTIILITLVLSSIIGMVFYSILTMNENQKAISKILDIEKQNTYILKILGTVLETETDILLAKNEKDFERIDSQLFDLDKIVKFQRLKESKYKSEYNPLINELEESLAYEIKLQQDFFSAVYTLYIYKQDLKNYLFKLEEVINEIHEKINVISEHSPSLKDNLFDLESSTFNLFTLLRDIMFVNSLVEINEIKKNKLEQSYLIVGSFLEELRINAKNDSVVSNLVNTINLSLVNIDSIKNSFILLRLNMFNQESNLEEIIASRTYQIAVITSNINKATEITEKIILDSLVHSDEITTRTIITAVLIGIFSFLILTFISIILVARVNNPLEHIIKMIDDILANKVSLSKDIEVEYNDEYKKLVDAFNQMTRSIDKNIQSLKMRDEEISLLNKDLEKRVELRTEELFEKNQKITDLFNNAKQGFLSLDRSLTVGKEYSKECEKLLGNDIFGKKVDELFDFESSEQKLFFNKTLLDIFNEKDEIVQNSFIELLPKEFIINRRAISMEYKRLNDEKFMIILTNITHKKKLEQKIKKEQQLLKMIVTIISDTTQFYELINDFKSFANNKLKIFDINNSALFNLSEIYREVHTFKGLFSQVYMSNSVKRLHTFESEISEYIKDKKFTNKELGKLLEKSDFLSWIDDDLEIIKSILGKEFLDEDSVVKVNEDTIIHLENKIKEYCKLDRKHLNNYEDILFETQRLRLRTLYQALTPYPKLCEELANSLDKQIYPFKILGEETIVLPTDFKLFVKSLIHIFRNLIDHGIEDIETRLEQGKNEKGTIVCSFKLEGDFLTILISDDGRGIDRNKIRKKVEELNLLPLEEFDKMSDEKVYDLIFHDSFSTKEEITELSGRGIGMSVVKNELIKINGTVQIKSVINEGSTFIFKLPYGRK